MTNKLTYISLFLMVSSCTHAPQTNHDTLLNQIKTSTDSIATPNSKNFFMPDIGEPFQISDIESLEFTSGGGKLIGEHQKCDSSQSGFYGSYFLIDPNYSDEIGRPVGGTITVYSEKKMRDWKSSDTNQTIWEIHLESDVISVWDSVRIGLTRSEVEKFNTANNGFHIKKGEVLYSCDFNDFSVVYIFDNDTVKELTVTRKCNRHNAIDLQ